MLCQNSCIKQHLLKHYPRHQESTCMSWSGPWHSAPCVLSSFVLLVWKTDFPIVQGYQQIFCHTLSGQNSARSWILSFKPGCSGFRWLLMMLLISIRFDCRLRSVIFLGSSKSQRPLGAFKNCIFWHKFRVSSIFGSKVMVIGSFRNFSSDFWTILTVYKWSFVIRWDEIALEALNIWFVLLLV